MRKGIPEHQRNTADSLAEEQKAKRAEKAKKNVLNVLNVLNVHEIYIKYLPESIDSRVDII